MKVRVRENESESKGRMNVRVREDESESKGG